MSEKFKYAPGKPGYGTKGDRGEDGQQGLAMYFTNLNPTSQTIIINSKIENNYALWSGYDDPLPDNRVYVTGDLFFDREGLTYEINAETNTFEYKFASLNMGGYFIPLGQETSLGFKRYFNSNSTPKYIIDNVYTISGTIDYTAVPENIYNIVPKNFTRIEYTNIKSEPELKYNAFTVYSAGDEANAELDAHKALAIVYDSSDKLFRFGNLDFEGNLRNTNLIFDVSSLRQNKQSGNTFNVNTPEGTILTNSEIAANCLFDPIFDPNPDSFVGVIGVTDASVRWILTDFTDGDADVYGDLYFYEYIPSYNSLSFRSDSSTLRPLIFHNVSPNIGSVKITGLKSTSSYAYYMKLNKNGWTRNSDIKYLYKGTLNVTPTSLLDEPSGGHAVPGFNVDADATWSVSFGGASWITGLVCTSIGGHDGSIHFNMTENTGPARDASMTVSLFGGVSQKVALSQEGGVPNWNIDISYNGIYANDASIILTNIPNGVTIDLMISGYCWAYAYNEVSPCGNYYSSSQVDVNLNNLASCATDSIGCGESSDVNDSGNIGLSNLSNTDSVRLSFSGTSKQQYQDGEALSGGEFTISAVIHGTSTDVSILHNHIDWNDDHVPYLSNV